MRTWNTLTRSHDDRRSLRPSVSWSVKSSLKSPITIVIEPLNWSAWSLVMRSSIC